MYVCMYVGRSGVVNSVGVRLYMCVCVYVCMYVGISGLVNLCGCACMYVYTYVCICIYVQYACSIVCI